MSQDADYITVAAAWRACGHNDGDPIPEDFSDIYVAATIEHVASLIGHADELTEVLKIRRPGASVTLPWADGTITSVKDENGANLTDWTRAGATLTGTWDTAYLVITCTSFTVPASVKLAANQICRQLWLADSAGNSSGRPSGTDKVPQGFAIPTRALTLLDPYRTRLGL